MSTPQLGSASRPPRTRSLFGLPNCTRRIRLPAFSSYSFVTDSASVRRALNVCRDGRQTTTRLAVNEWSFTSKTIELPLGRA